MTDACHILSAKIDERSAKIGVIGLGYVGLPLASATAAAGFTTLGFDIEQEKVDRLNAGDSFIDAVPSDRLQKHISEDRFEATAALERMGECDILVICVPTPLSKYREPDLGYVEQTARDISATLRPAQLVVLESTTYPGTTDEVLKPILEAGGLKSGSDFFLGFSPEREDPGNVSFHTTSIPKVVAGDGEDASKLVSDFYGAVVDKVVTVSTPATAEAVKITENVFRAVNIALVNELKQIYDAMGIDIWEVIDAAATKPFGYMPFYPGPGLGGHCIPIDPFYLSWKSREFGMTTRFIELAGEINVAMPRYVISRLAEALDRELGVPLSRAKVLVIGVAYKKNVSDMRESPSLALLELLEERGATTAFHDPHVAVIPPTREHPKFTGRKSIDLTASAIANHDCVLIATEHAAVDYKLIAANAKLVVDTRNVIGKTASGVKVIKA